MRVLVATSRTQGLVDGDYCYTVDGELVLCGPPLECCSPEHCGCGRGFPGLASCRATTTAMIVELPELDRAQLGRAISDSLVRQGWLAGLAQSEIDEGVEDEITLIERVTKAFPLGAVLGRRGSQVSMRSFEAA
jgi:hypothetical protein